VPVGMTVSAFFSVSVAPPLIAVCLDAQAATLKVILASRQFAVNVLSTSQHSLSERFAKEDEPVRFDGIQLHEAEGTRSPLLAGSVVHLDCQLEATHEAGDHVLCIGRILVALSHPEEPLLFHASRYHRLAALTASGS
jgi:flavin reductase (DIM6/NTAB) family NADH-FMN oxidoreductase RutF